MALPADEDLTPMEKLLLEEGVAVSIEDALSFVVNRTPRVRNCKYEPSHAVQFGNKRFFVGASAVFEIDDGRKVAIPLSLPSPLNGMGRLKIVHTQAIDTISGLLRAFIDQGSVP